MEMLENGYELTEWRSGLFQVSSQYTEGASYTVDLAELHCTCPVGDQGMLCKHINLCLHIFKNRLHEYRETESEKLFDNGGYTIISDTKGEVSVYIDSFQQSVTASASSNLCGCASYSYHHSCAHLLLAHALFPNFDPADSLFDNPPDSFPPVNTTHNQTVELKVPPHPPLNSEYLEKLNAIMDYANRNDMTDIMKSHIDRLYACITPSIQPIPIKDKSKKRKIEPNNIERQRIVLKKRKLAVQSPHNDHTFACKKPKKPSKSKLIVKCRKRTIKKPRKPNLSYHMKKNKNMSATITFHELPLSSAAINHIALVRASTSLPSTPEEVLTFIGDLANVVMQNSPHLMAMKSRDTLDKLEVALLKEFSPNT